MWCLSVVCGDVAACHSVQVTKAGRHGIVRDAIAKMKTATDSVAGGRKQQLMALVNHI